VGEEAMENAVDVRKNLLVEILQAMVLTACWSDLEDIKILCANKNFSQKGTTSVSTGDAFLKVLL
jgi:hypothetical protein